MEKQKRWQLVLILTVLLLTLYNILPTVFFYTKPLKAPINQERANEVALEIVQRVDSLESGAVEWVHSFNKLIGVKAKDVSIRQDDPRLIDVTFGQENEASRFRKLLPRAGSLIPFLPSQLELYSGNGSNPNQVTVMRQIGIHMDPKDSQALFSYVAKYQEDGSLNPAYKALVADRVDQIATGLAGASPLAREIEALLSTSTDSNQDDLIVLIAEELNDIQRTTAKIPSLSKRVWNYVPQTANVTKSPSLIASYLTRLEGAKTRLSAKVEELKKSKNGELLAQAERNLASLDKASQTLKRSDAELKKAHAPIDIKVVRNALLNGKALEGQETISLKGYNPYVESLIVDFADDKIYFQFYDDINLIRQENPKSEELAYQKEKLSQLIYNEIARVGRFSDETILPNENGFAINLSDLPDTHSFLTFNLGEVAQKQSESLQAQLTEAWNPLHPDLAKGSYPVRTWKDFNAESASQKKFGLVIFSPSMVSGEVPEGFRKGSIYVIARGLTHVLDKAKAAANKPLEESLNRDLTQLKAILTQNGFIGYSGASYGIDKEYSKDFIFELDDYYSSLIRATRENFDVKGSKKVAILPFTNVEQRIITRNKIEDQIQEDLLKWRDEYNAAQVDLDVSSRYQIPAPTENPFWSNFKINVAKYFRGDDRKILKWGLDLSGGKSVRIGLKDHNGQAVTNPADVKQAVNELYTRINKMGVSERTIRVENNNIVLEFPGSQAMSASDLVKASQMSFHIVNEKFSPYNTSLKSSINQFLQEVWNEAVVTNRKSADDVNEIAWQHLGGTSFGQMETRPVSEAAKTLIENGLVLSNPKEKNATGTFNDQLSMVAVARGDDFAEWEGQTHPLLFVFQNWALEGSSLSNIQTAFDPAEGNTLSFSVKRSYEGQNAPAGSPRDDFYAWTSQFAEDRIAGTPKEIYTQGRGYRMAVILNGTVISKPVLRAALKDSASISGRFTQREVNQLAADLKAGSLSFTPRILSEQNISAELGSEERTKGITASFVALALIAVAMIGYYRFAGVVATVAVLVNILIMWGVLQNLDAALTLPGIAGIVLTIGMAVDANVLVFERIREEFAISGRIASAIQAGYRKAFSAIFDSNITSIMAALVLIQFDSGPIKGFAVTLIIGIFSSMFTALFMTRYFFAGWVKNPENKELKMSQWIHGTRFDFLSKARTAIIISVIVTALGGLLLFKERNTIFGMDFTGGYSLLVEVEPKPETESYRLLALDALHESGASSTDVEVRQLNLPNQLRISLSQGMDQPGHPFYSLPQEVQEGEFAYLFQKNPRIDWVVKSLQTHGLTLSENTLENLEMNWSVVSGQFSDTMRNNALMGLAIALLSILIYITIRFEFKYAVAAVIALIHDVVITMGILALFHWMGFPVQIDLQVVGAIMTIIGYSLNDTIIVFDRIREDLKIYRKLSYYDAVNHALNVTLSRTLMTSGTTLLVLFTLVLLGGSSIFAFALVMTIGVLVGTISSLFVASPVLLWMHEREVKEAQLKHS